MSVRGKSECGRSYISVMSVCGRSVWEELLMSVRGKSRCGRSYISVMSVRGRSVCGRSYFLNLVYVGGVNECMSRIVQVEDWAGEDLEV